MHQYTLVEPEKIHKTFPELVSYVPREYRNNTYSPHRFSDKKDNEDNEDNEDKDSDHYDSDSDHVLYDSGNE